jgi:hypothetical protein
LAYSEKVYTIISSRSPATVTTATRIFGHIYSGVARLLETIPTDCEPTSTPPHASILDLPVAFLLGMGIYREAFGRRHPKGLEEESLWCST